MSDWNSSANAFAIGLLAFIYLFFTFLLKHLQDFGLELNFKKNWFDFIPPNKTTSKQKQIMKLAVISWLIGIIYTVYSILKVHNIL